MIYLTAGGKRRERLQGAVPEVHGNAAVGYLGVGDDSVSCRAGGDLRERGAYKAAAVRCEFSGAVFAGHCGGEALRAAVYRGAERGKALFLLAVFSGVLAPDCVAAAVRRAAHRDFSRGERGELTVLRSVWEVLKYVVHGERLRESRRVNASEPNDVLAAENIRERTGLPAAPDFAAAVHAYETALRIAGVHRGNAGISLHDLNEFRALRREHMSRKPPGIQCVNAYPVRLRRPQRVSAAEYAKLLAGVYQHIAENLLVFRQLLRFFAAYSAVCVRGVNFRENRRIIRGELELSSGASRRCEAENIHQRVNREQNRRAGGCGYDRIPARFRGILPDLRRLLGLRFWSRLLFPALSLPGGVLFLRFVLDLCRYSEFLREVVDCAFFLPCVQHRSFLIG